MRLSDFNYTLPPDLIAQHPTTPRDAARLMVVDRSRGSFEHRIFCDLPEYLRAGDVLVLNDTRVIPARLHARTSTGGAVEVLLLRPAPSGAGLRPTPHGAGSSGQDWEVLLRPGRRARRGTRLLFRDTLAGEVVESRPEGVSIVRFRGDRPPLEAAQEIGEMPVPPYIHEPLQQADDYQTVYATVDGAVAAPTAGLHFTQALLDRIWAGGVQIVTLTMHIGLPTFRPVTVQEIERHHMDTEWYGVSAEAAAAIAALRLRSLRLRSGQAGRGPSTSLRAGRAGRVVVVGTSAVRALETVAANDGIIRPASGWSTLFIYPGYRFKATDVLVTNFHLPKTTLLMLVSAFAGRELILRAYEEAIRECYRFYSFGDAMLIL